MNYDLVSFDTPLALAQAAAEQWLAHLDAANRRNEEQFVALSGGRIARDFFSAIADGSRKQLASLKGVRFFWADERCVPPDNSESNFRLANENLFKPLGINPDHIHRINGELPPDAAARQAQEELQGLALSDEKGQPVLDLIFLGMGEDGHVASLFPGLAEANRNSNEVYLAVVGPKPPPNRITLSYRAIAAARDVWVLASGAGKAETLQKSLDGSVATPLARVLAQRRFTKIFSNVSA